MLTKTIFYAYLSAAVVAGGYFYWRSRAFRACEREFLVSVDTLEESVTETLLAYHRCNLTPDPEKSIDSLMARYEKEGLLFFTEDHYEYTEALFRRLAALSTPWTQARLLHCHKRLLRLDRAVEACNFPALCNRIAGWIPDEYERLNHLRKHPVSR